MTDDEIREMARTTIFSYDEIQSVAFNLSRPQGSPEFADSRVIKVTLELAALRGGQLYGPIVNGQDMGPVAAMMRMMTRQPPEPSGLHPHNYTYTLHNGKLERKE